MIGREGREGKEGKKKKLRIRSKKGISADKKNTE
jgi:hypothetical protein